MITVSLSWRLNRVAALETNLLTLTASPIELRRTNRASWTSCCTSRKLYEEKGETYNPSEDGFVFTQSQINRDRLYGEALVAA